MKHRIFLSIAFSILAISPSQAEPIGAAEFDAFTRGKTLLFGLSGQEPYGAEEYFGNQRVRWSFLDGQCVEGRWYEKGTQICFIYESELGEQCWEFSADTSTGLTATFVQDEPPQPIYQITPSSDPLYCQGPEVGV